MTTAQLDTLKAALKGELRRQEGEDPPAHPNTLGSLVRRGLLERSQRFSRHETRMDVWTITDAGRDALKAPELVGTERSVFPAKGGGSTSDWTRAVDHDPKMGALDDMGAPSEEWLRVSRMKKAAVKDRRQVARALARQIRAA